MVWEYHAAGGDTPTVNPKIRTGLFEIPYGLFPYSLRTFSLFPTDFFPIPYGLFRESQRTLTESRRAIAARDLGSMSSS